MKLYGINFKVAREEYSSRPIHFEKRLQEYPFKLGPDPIANPLLRILHPHADATSTKAERISLHPRPPNPCPIPNPIPMEVEVKLCLPDAVAHRRLSAYLARRLLRTEAQRNAFFDAPARPLAAASAALRVRLYGPDDRDPSRAVLALKRRARIDVGVRRVEEVEEPLDPEAERLRLDDDSQARHYREAEDKLGHSSRCRHRAP
ncbi:triphosphate tunel metalloenzyme 3-like [Hordeum vulgare]|nr:triphosphate tunel metalloenzyme 3-like [Hordeum vulgare]